MLRMLPPLLSLCCPQLAAEEGTHGACLGNSSSLAPAECAAWQDLFDGIGLSKNKGGMAHTRQEPCGSTQGGEGGVVCKGGHITHIQVFPDQHPLHPHGGHLPPSVVHLAHLEQFVIFCHGLVGAVPPMNFSAIDNFAIHDPMGSRDCFTEHGKIFADHPNNFSCPLPPGASEHCHAKCDLKLDDETMTMTMASPPGSPTITPLPQCREPRGAPAAAVTLAADTSVVSDDPLAAATLTAALQKQCTGVAGTSATGAAGAGAAAAPPPPKVLLQLPGRQQTAALAARGLQLRDVLGREGYLLDIDAAAGGVLIAAHNTSGLFHGVQTLLQSLGSTGCEVGAARVEDYPDSPLRGVYMVGGWDAFPETNATAKLLTDTLDQMAKYKHSFAMFNANGTCQHNAPQP